MLRISFSFFSTRFPNNSSLLCHSSSATLHKFSLVTGHFLKANRFRNCVSNFDIGGTGTVASTFSAIAGVLSSACVLTAGAGSSVSTGPLKDSGWSAGSMFRRCSVPLLLRCGLAMYTSARVELSAAIFCQHEIPQWDTERVIKVDTAALSFRYCSQKASVPQESPSWSFLRPTLAATAAATY